MTLDEIHFAMIVLGFVLGVVSTLGTAANAMIGDDVLED